MALIKAYYKSPFGQKTRLKPALNLLCCLKNQHGILGKESLDLRCAEMDRATGMQRKVG
jgi:hypothetical protein